jgi:hypothetical protein
MKVTLDGTALMPQSWFVGPALFDLTTPAQNNYLGAPGHTGAAGVYGTESICAR